MHPKSRTTEAKLLYSISIGALAIAKRIITFSSAHAQKLLPQMLASDQSWFDDLSSRLPQLDSRVHAAHFACTLPIESGKN
jgi:hypothetical protein